MPEEIKEQVDSTAIQESTTEEPVVEQKEVPSEFKAPTEDEYNKAIQSASSKAKYELLQELGIKNVDEFKALRTQYDDAIKQTETLKTERDTFKSQAETSKRDLLLNKMGVSDEFKDDLITLAKSKVTDKLDFESAARDILEKNPNWRVSQETVKLGTEKSKSTTEEVVSSLTKKYPWIH